jgi:lincosamide nucleotidyltransferase B/F
MTSNEGTTNALNPQFLLQRLNNIGHSLAQSGRALALIGLGSVGLELDRLDAYSDLDFFVIVEPGCKRLYLDGLGWLSRLGSIAYQFANTPDGYKLLFADGVFCEFAVFEPDELSQIPFTAGRVVWKRPEVAETIGQPVMSRNGQPERDREWLLGEALTNLYVGLGREQRGERLSAVRFIQGYAVDRLLELVEGTEVAQPTATRDAFALERRFEQRHSHIAPYAPSWLQGYTRNRESALAILSFLEERFAVNAALATAIRQLCV